MKSVKSAHESSDFMVLYKSVFNI